MTPAGLRVSPAGSEPVNSDQVGVPVPPEEARGAEYAAPTVAAGREVVVIVSAALTVIDSD
jgi:hypothetical protein